MDQTLFTSLSFIVLFCNRIFPELPLTNLYNERERERAIHVIVNIETRVIYGTERVGDEKHMK